MNKEIKQAVIDLLNGLKKREAKEGIVSYVANVLHFEERWIQTELCSLIQKMMKDKVVMMEDERRDCTIYKNKTERYPEFWIEIKTLKNYDLSFWLPPFDRDLKKLETRGSKKTTNLFLVFFLYSEPTLETKKLHVDYQMPLKKYEKFDKTISLMKKKVSGKCKLKKIHEVKLKSNLFKDLRLLAFMGEVGNW